MLSLPAWTDHANRRKIRYNITEGEIAETWLFGEAYRKDDRGWKIVGDDITLVVDETGEVIITMYRNSGADRYFEASARLNKVEGNIRGITFIK